MIASTALACLLSCIAAPVPPQKLPRFADLVASIGTDFRGDVFRPVGRALGPKPTLLMHGWEPRKPSARPYPSGVDYGYYMAWASKGVQCYIADNLVNAIWLENRFDYRPNPNSNDAYTGELPDGLTLDDDAATVIRKMGPPEEPFEAIGPVPASAVFPERTETALGYPSRGLTVVTWKLPGAKEVIFHVSVQKPRKPERK